MAVEARQHANGAIEGASHQRPRQPPAHSERERFEPIQQLRAHEYVAEQIRRHIALRLIGPGESLPSERDLATIFGVGRPTIQHALRLLEADRLVEARRGRRGGTFVSEPAQDAEAMDELLARILRRRAELEDVLVYRRVIEPQVAWEAARTRRRSDLTRIGRAIAAIANARTDPDYMREDTAFHLAIAHATRNRFLVSAIEDIRLRLNDVVSLLPESDTWHRRLSDEHNAIVAAIEARDRGRRAGRDGSARGFKRAGRTRGADSNPQEARIVIVADETNVFPRLLDLAYPSVERGDGVWLYTTDGEELLDACSGGAMVACLGHGDRAIVEAARAQAQRISYLYNHHFSNEPQERLAERLLGVAAPEMARIRFVSGGSEANEMALRLVRQYHVDRGEADRWRIISQAQSYHGATMGTLALTGRDSLKAPYGEYLPGAHAHPAGDLALGSIGRGRARGARPDARDRRAGDGRGVLLRAGERGCAARRIHRPSASGRGWPSAESATAS